MEMLRGSQKKVVKHFPALCRALPLARQGGLTEASIFSNIKRTETADLYIYIYNMINMHVYSVYVFRIYTYIQNICI